MRSHSLNRFPARVRAGRTLPPGTGMMIAGAVSLLLWGVIAGVAVVV